MPRQVTKRCWRDGPKRTPITPPLSSRASAIDRSVLSSWLR